MAYVPLRIPPGVYRNGTKYQSMGRWFSADLVRWREGAMQPIGGWEEVTRGQPDFTYACRYEDGVGYTNYTTEINSATTGDVVIFGSSPSVNDCFFFGYTQPWSTLVLTTTTALNESGKVEWAYWNSSDWQDLDTWKLTRNNDDLTLTGTRLTEWHLPSNWASVSVNGEGPYYFIRLRISLSGATGSVTGSYADQSNGLYLGAETRSLLGWRNNTNVPFLAAGTAVRAYAFYSGTLVDITPTTFTVGYDSAQFTAGAYDQGVYSAGPYGSGDEAQGTLVEANTWQFDSFGQQLVACAYSDGKLLAWDLNPSNNLDTMANSPTNCKGIVVTPERMVVGLGANGERNKVHWSDQEDYTVWTAASTNQAGFFYLSGHGSIQCAARTRSETLIWTDVDLHAMRYIGGALVYQFVQVGTNCGITSRQAKAIVDNRAFWMGDNGFFMYDGAVRPISCAIYDAIFPRLNRIQKSKIVAVPMSEFNEIWFLYTSLDDPTRPEENNSVVAYNYLGNFWSGPWGLYRTAGIDSGVFDYPVMADEYGRIYYHERGETYLDRDLNGPTPTALIPSAESGPIEIANGDQVMTVRRFIPDENTLGDVDATIYASFYPTATEASQALTIAAPTDVRLTGRQVRLRIVQDRPGWRVGVPRLEVVPRGLR